MNNNQGLHYKDVYLVPNLSDLSTRQEADTSIILGNHDFRVPVVPSNMKCTIDPNLAKKLSDSSYFYIMHRFNVDNVAFAESLHNYDNQNIVSISVGVKDEDLKVIETLRDRRLRVDYITVDIAHGHSTLMQNTLKHIKKHLPNTFIIAGNVATKEGAKFLVSHGADAVKVGIGQGFVCTTKDKTGFTCPMFSCVQEVAEGVTVPVIADGGVRCNGDIAKALVAGAKMVMCGSVFAKCQDSPGAVVRTSDGQTYKEYYGSASAQNKGHSNNVEGITKLIDLDPITYIDKLKEIKQDLQSAISYAGGTTLDCLTSVRYGVQLTS